MNKVYLNFKEFELGFLFQKDDSYVWIPNADEIKRCFSKYDGAFDLFMLNFSEATSHKEIPYHFCEFIENAERQDIKKSAKIKEKDSDFEKLLKVASLKFANQDFYISV